MFKKLRKPICFILCTALSLSLAACSSADEKRESQAKTKSRTQTSIPLDKEEKELLEKVEDDIHVVTDDTYIETMIELISHTSQFSGQLYQMEGSYLSEGGVSYISRTLVNGNERSRLSLPLNYLNKSFLSGTWIKVTGIVSEGEVNGEQGTILEVLAVEAPSETGLEELPWDGSLEHQH
ncbi:MAG: hypothetical protein HFI75_12010 [Lachnospiraceae bacterium]|nr:hypothetical protein [Lachnospiraceae bacterium]